MNVFDLIGGVPQDPKPPVTHLSMYTEETESILTSSTETWYKLKAGSMTLFESQDLKEAEEYAEFNKNVLFIDNVKLYKKVTTKELIKEY